MEGNAKQTRLLEEGHYVGMKFQEGWWFFHVIGRETIDLKTYTLDNENGNKDVIAPRTAGSEDDEITDSRDRNYLLPKDSEQNLVFQVLFGIEPSRMQVYPFFGRNRSPNLRGKAEPGTIQVPYDGFDSPYNNPSTDAELFTVNDQERPAFQAYNPMREPAEAKVSFHVNKLRYATVDDVGLMKAMLQGQVPARTHMTSLGAQNSDQLRAPNWLQDTFGDEIMTTEEILNHKGGPDSTSVVPQGTTLENLG